MTGAVPTISDRICTAILIALSACELLHLVFGQTWAVAPARGLALALLLAVIPRFGFREWALLALALGLVGGLWWRGDTEAVTGALAKGAYFTAFILLMMLLREAAVTSASVLDVGAWISRQPPGRRFVVTWWGGHVAGILMNFGAVSLLAPLIQRGVRAGPQETPDDRRRTKVRERRQLSALIRGFAFVICWAPTTLTQVIILGSVPDLNPVTAITWGLGLSLLMLGVGWAEDRLRWGRPRRVPEDAPPFPRGAALDLLVVYILLVGGALALVGLASLPLPVALMSVAPIMLCGWVIVQARLGTIPSAPRRLAEIASVSIPRMAKDAYLLGAAGFIGITAAELAPVDAIATWTEAAGVSSWVFVAALPVLITLAGQIALSPMMMVVFLAAVVSALPALPAPPHFIALALGAGWSLSMTASPNATGALLLAGATGVPSTTLTWRWNGVYSLTVLAILTVLSWVLVP